MGADPVGPDAGHHAVIDADTGGRVAEVSTRAGAHLPAPQGDRLATIGSDNVAHLYAEQSK